MSIEAPITKVATASYRFPTPAPESDGTLSWNATTAVTVEVSAGGMTGLGWSYTSDAAGSIIATELTDVVYGRDAFDISGAWEAMVRACRNLGRPGVVSQAIAAVDIALWDLKAKLLDVPLHHLFGTVRDTVPVYGSGGFTSMDDDALRHQLDDWLRAGATAVKIKIGEDWGANPLRDLHRVALVNTHVPGGTTVMVDANGGYTPGQALEKLRYAFERLKTIEPGVDKKAQVGALFDRAARGYLRTALDAEATALTQLGINMQIRYFETPKSLCPTSQSTISSRTCRR